MSYYKLPIVFVCFIVVGFLSGYLAGPAVSRLDARVQLAARIQVEQEAEQQGELLPMTVESEAWYETGETAENLYERAREVEHDFTWGMAFVGAFIGLAAACKVAGLRMVEPADIYYIHQGRCVSCTRCFLACPVEHERLQELGKEQAKPKL
jgi:NAD-dependent dihydropyrimidine dehydrogenase PreA subunit